MINHDQPWSTMLIWQLNLLTFRYGMIALWLVDRVTERLSKLKWIQFSLLYCFIFVSDGSNIRHTMRRVRALIRYIWYEICLYLQFTSAKPNLYFCTLKIFHTFLVHSLLLSFDLQFLLFSRLMSLYSIVFASKVFNSGQPSAFRIRNQCLNRDRSVWIQ